MGVQFCRVTQKFFVLLLINWKISEQNNVVSCNIIGGVGTKLMAISADHRISPGNHH